MASQPQPQPQPAPSLPSSYGAFPPSSDPNYNSRPGPPPRASTLPYHTRPDASETTYNPRPSDAPAVASSYSYPPPPLAPTQIPIQTSSTTTTSYNPPPLSHASPRPIPEPKFESLHGGPGGPIPYTSVPNHTYPQQQQQQQQQQPPPTFPPPPIASTTATTTALANTSSRQDSPLTEARDATVSALREWIATRRQHVMVNRVNGVSGVGSNGVGVNGGVNGAGMDKVDQVAEVEGRLRAQTGAVLAGLRGLQGRVGEVVRVGEGGRWRRVFIGGVVASFIPLVKKLFRRPKHEDESANRTEYAFKKSKGLVARILASTHRPGLGTLAFFVFAVLYVFTNEVSLRVGRTVSKRLRRLIAKVEDGREEVTEGDVKVLQGWRWRILNWSE